MKYERSILVKHLLGYILLLKFSSVKETFPKINQLECIFYKAEKKCVPLLNFVCTQFLLFSFRYTYILAELKFTREYKFKKHISTLFYEKENK